MEISSESESWNSESETDETFSCNFNELSSSESIKEDEKYSYKWKVVESNSPTNDNQILQSIENNLPMITLSIR